MLSFFHPLKRLQTAPAASIPIIAQEPVLIVSDTDRDGQITRSDLQDRDRWSWSSGGFMLANLDDDDQDGIRDSEDSALNGEHDIEDLAIVRIGIAKTQIESGAQLALTVSPEAQEFVNLFQNIQGDWQPLPLDSSAGLEIDDRNPETITLGIEARQFADRRWNGKATLQVNLQTRNGEAIATDAIELRVAPWILLPNTAPVTDLYVSYGYYPNERMLAQLEATLPKLEVTLHEAESFSWEEMWMQDTMEIGYQQLPGRPPMSVVLRANRGKDRYPKTLLAPDMGYMVIGKVRNVNELDLLVDWMGNLEVTPPLPDYPLGRVYYGKNVETEENFHPTIVDFIERQEVQSPTWVDTSWLEIKHVDEIFSFVNDRDGNLHLLMNSFRDGSDLMEKLVEIVGSDPIVGNPPLTVGETLDYIPDNRQLQRDKLDAILEKAKADFQLNDDQIITLPAMVTGQTAAMALWSNPINSVHVNGTVFVGDPLAPFIDGEDYLQSEIRDRLKPLGVDVKFLDDNHYQLKGGNVHCATNAKRLPVVDFWKALPESWG